MSIENVEKAMLIIKNHQYPADFDGEKSEALITKAEGYLGLKFPPSYRYFLQKLGCGDVLGHEFYGLINDDFANSGIPDAVWLTMKERKKSKLPERFIVIYSFGDGDYAVLDCNQNEDGLTKVFKWSSGSSEPSFEVMNDDFGDFFYQTVNASVS
ncbi:SMI1/KNR4 family protein [Buttiauxella sp. B2]|uniref:SMI1/KNR4 family protein n=1 Tax=Buttiauxella sp. B2 TaxID=2587812 RepID=UPI001123CDF3|nr:SMI1/KNR4 family protein [Buttiauxella sp. B2]TNV09780.1 SMI1/KNR4 family protein [Buttiauxella sp. B2]